MTAPLKATLRKSYIEMGELCFWTATIHQWHRLLSPDHYKDVIIDTLAYLSEKKLAEVFAFVIMPNHLHLIWRTLAPNGKESPQASLLKYTAHRFKQRLQHDNPSALEKFKVAAANKDYQFWQRDSLTVSLYTRPVAMQKLDYIHYNPLASHWQLVKDPSEYYYSSAAFYENSVLNFPFLKDLREEL
ncbi:MAG TPA: transposase [Flavisolibacter sp.]|nr:transposase [Flavisolibacter sp.]